MRTARPLAVLILCLFASALAARDLEPDRLEVDQKGPLPTRDLIYTVKSVESADSMVLRVYAVPRSGAPYAIATVLMVGVPTKGIADGKNWRPEDVYRVTGTKKVPGYGTVHVLEPQK